MLCFKNWLILENLGTFISDIYFENLRLEKALEKTAQVFFDAFSFESKLIEAYEQGYPPVQSMTPEDKKVIGKRLMNAVLWMRWKAMMDRQTDINKLIEIKNAYKAQYPQQAREVENKLGISPMEESNWSNALASARSNLQVNKSSTKFDLAEASRILQKLGYINPSTLERDKSLNDEEKDIKIIEAMYKATREKGNEIPLDVRRMGVDKINAKAVAANKMFMDILTDVFKNNYTDVFSDSRNLQRTDGKKRGTRYYGNPLDVATSFILSMNKLITKRKVNSKGDAKPWHSPESYDGQIGSKGYEAEMLGGSESSRNFAKEIFKTFMRQLYKETNRQQTDRAKTTSPSQRLPDTQVLGGNRTRKQALINDDLRKAAELKSKGQSTEPVLGFYLTYLKNHIEGKAPPATKKRLDNYRLDIMDHIMALMSRYPDLYSAESHKIENTLSNYNLHVLINRPKSSSTFLSDLTPSKSEDEVETYFDPENTDSVMRGERSAHRTDPTASSQDSELTSIILKVLDQIMRELATINPKAAFAICVKWGLGCNPQISNEKVQSVTIDSVEQFTRLAIALTKSGSVVGGQKANCAKQLQAIGIKGYLEIAEIMKARYGIDTNRNSVGLDLNAGFEYMCRRMKEILSAQLT